MLMGYAKIGLKAGLEIHQQLDTNKLFCACPSVIRKDKPDLVVTRELRPLAGETGEIDPAAIFEGKKRKFYKYEAYNDTTCLVELDEEPPHKINQEALEAALLVAKMLHCDIPETIQIMRKTVVDGSNTSGFQRTCLIGTNGYLDTKYGKVGIQNINLEEDACRRTNEDKESVTFRLDRLGIPLIEIGTAPDIKTPEQGRELAEKIGMLLRSTGKVKRGLGTIRQDLNVSIKGGTRIEIKGVQALKQIPALIEKEVERQQKIIAKKQKVKPEVRNAQEDGTTKFLRPLPGAARMYPETDIPLIPISRLRIETLKIPESIAKKEERFVKLGLSKDLAQTMSRWKNVKLFEKLVKENPKVKPNVIASTLLSIPKQVKKKVDHKFIPTDEQYAIVFSLLNKGKIVKEALLDIFVELSKQKDIEKVIIDFEKLSDKELKEEIKNIKEKNKSASEGKLIGIAMSKLRTRADPKKIMQLIKKT
ncbi:Glu-tRNA(Gln) amidotransferase subunit GatE [Candidatus Woesearchaeota archaeon]|nr:Glu-tRNA(Gln) amidotransferase subunit GatE [Candidatus Woesearchaeota archaeon]